VKDIKFAFVGGKVERSPLIKPLGVDIGSLITMLLFINKIFNLLKSSIFSSHQKVLVVSFLLLPPFLDCGCVLRVYTDY
jgi:hypothetical protein